MWIFNEFTDMVNMQARLAAYADAPHKRPWLGVEWRYQGESAPGVVFVRRKAVYYQPRRKLVRQFRY